MTPNTRGRKKPPSTTGQAKEQEQSSEGVEKLNTPAKQQHADQETESEALMHESAMAKAQSSALQEQLLFEYDQLRKEVLQNDTFIIQLLSVISVLTGTLMGFAFTQALDDQTKASLFFIVCAVSLLGTYQNTDRIRSIYRISSYIRTFIEPEMKGLQWERRLRVFRIKRDQLTKKGFNVITDPRVLYLAIMIVNFTMGIYFLARGYVVNPSLDWLSLIFPICVVAVISLFLGFWVPYNTLNKQFAKDFDALWGAVKSDEVGPTSDAQTYTPSRNG